MTSRIHRRAVQVMALALVILALAVAPAAAAPALQDGGTEVPDQVAQALLLAGVVEVVVAHYLLPLFKPNQPPKWTALVYLVLGGVLAWFAGVNLFMGLFPGQELVGRIVSCVLVGGGPGLVRGIAGGIAHQVAQALLVGVVVEHKRHK